MILIERLALFYKSCTLIVYTGTTHILCHSDFGLERFYLFTYGQDWFQRSYKGT